MLTKCSMPRRFGGKLIRQPSLDGFTIQIDFECGP
jgi:hypothetical protein